MSQVPVRYNAGEPPSHWEIISRSDDHIVLEGEGSVGTTIATLWLDGKVEVWVKGDGDDGYMSLAYTTKCLPSLQLIGKAEFGEGWRRAGTQWSAW